MKKSKQLISEPPFPWRRGASVREMRTTEKLIVTVSPTGSFQGKESNPALPYSPQEIADDVRACWNEGAAIVHIQCRDENGVPTNDRNFFRERDRLIREQGCAIIIQHSTSPGPPGATIDDGIKTIEVNPEMASLSMGIGFVLTRGKWKANARSRAGALSLATD
jgi:uncharacterized protein (DUF849 family)